MALLYQELDDYGYPVRSLAGEDEVPVLPVEAIKVYREMFDRLGGGAETPPPVSLN